jgi:hypothetical protein
VLFSARVLVESARGQLQVARECELGQVGGWVRGSGLAGRAVSERVCVLPEGASLLASIVRVKKAAALWYSVFYNTYPAHMHIF